MAGALGIVAALVAGFARLSPYRLVRWISAVYVEIFRGTSALVQLFFAYYVLPFFGIDLSPITAAVLVLGLNVSAYGSEVVRGAVKSVPAGQHEAALALNLSAWHRFRLVTLPQAGLAMIPPAGNLMIELMKGTALVSLVSVTEVSFEARRLQIATGEVTATYTALLLVYFAISLMIVAVFKVAERRLSRHWRERRSRWCLVFSSPRRSRHRGVSVPVRVGVEFIRGTPLLAQLFFLYYVFPHYGITLTAWAVGMLGPGVHYSTYLSEVYRSGLDNLPPGQWEACTALGLSSRVTWLTGAARPESRGDAWRTPGDHRAERVQHFNLFPHMTALDNVAAAPRHSLGLSKQEASRLAMDHLDLVGLSQKADAYPGTLSGGQQQRWRSPGRARGRQPGRILRPGRRRRDR